MIKVLFLIHDLGPGGAEKVLVNLVNNMDQSKFDVTVMTLFDEGINRQFLRPEIHYKTIFKRMFRGNSHVMKLLPPKILHRLFIKEHYDIEVSYLEGPTARIISGSPCLDTKIVCWIHIEQHTRKRVSGSFRNLSETISCYNRFNKIICVSETVKEDFSELIPLKREVDVLYNTNESEKIISLSHDSVNDVNIDTNTVKLIGVGKLLRNKGFDRILRIVKRLKDERYPVQLLILGVGPEEESLRKYIRENQLEENCILLGYQTNPYKYVAKSDLFVCASFAEGFSTAATEALIVGTPVCTVEVSGMKEMLGENNEYGVIVNNDDEALYCGIKSLLDNPKLFTHYKIKAAERGKDFSTQKTVQAVENMLLSL